MLAASNLAVALRHAGDAAGAARAILYAEHLAPDAALIASNKGYIALALGDGDAAHQAFAHVLKNAPENVFALAGTGYLAYCAKDFFAAAKAFRATIGGPFVPLAEVGLSDMEESAPAAEWADIMSTAQPVPAPGTGAGAAGQGGGVPGGPGLSIGEPPFPESWHELTHGGAVPLSRYVLANEEARRAALDLRDQTNREIAAALQPSTGPDGSIIRPIRPSRILFAIGDITSIFQRRINAILLSFNPQYVEMRDLMETDRQQIERIWAAMRGEVGRIEEACNRANNCDRQEENRQEDHLRYVACQRQAAIASEFYYRWRPLMLARWNAAVKELGDLWSFSGGWIARLDPLWNRNQNASREMLLREDIAFLLMDFTSLLGSPNQQGIMDYFFLQVLPRRPRRMSAAARHADHLQETSDLPGAIRPMVRLRTVEPQFFRRQLQRRLQETGTVILGREDQRHIRHRLVARHGHHLRRPFLGPEGIGWADRRCRKAAGGSLHHLPGGHPR